MRDFIIELIRQEILEELIPLLPKGDRALMQHLAESSYSSQMELAEWMDVTQGWVNQLLCGMYARAYRGSIYTRAADLADQTDLAFWMRLLQRYPSEESYQDDAYDEHSRFDLIKPIGDDHAPVSVRRTSHVTASDRRKVGPARKTKPQISRKTKPKI